MLTESQLSSIGFRWMANKLDPLTPYGAELVRHPVCYTSDELGDLHSEQDRVRLFISLIREKPDEINALTRLLMPLKDIRRSLNNCGVITLTEVELFEIKRFLMQLALIAPVANPITSACKEDITITPIPEALDIIDPSAAKSPTFYIADSFSERLSALRCKRKELDLTIRGETDRVKREALIVERTLLAADEENETASIRSQIGIQLAVYKQLLLSNITTLGKIDYALARARLAIDYNGIMPCISQHKSLEVLNMVNPMVQEYLKKDGRNFTPISISLTLGSTVITGANMGGKSIAIKTLALNCALAMCGYPVFAQKAELPALGGIFLLCDDGEDAKRGLSSFGGEMRCFDEILTATAKTKNSLVLLDEFARGTNPQEGGALVKAAVMCFNRRVRDVCGSVYAVIATHFDGVACLANAHYQVAGLRNADRHALNTKVQSKSGNVAKVLEGFMDYGLYPVSPYEEPPRDAVSICRALNVSDEFLGLVKL